MLKSFILSVSFSHFGTKETISESFNGGNVYKQVVEVSENVGELSEFHSGIYYEQISLDVSMDLETQVIDYLKKNNKEMYYSVYDMDNVFLFNEYEYGDIYYINGEPYKSKVFTDVKSLLTEVKILVDDGTNIEYTRGAIELVASFLKHNNNDSICTSDTKIFIAKYIGLRGEVIAQL